MLNKKKGGGESINNKRGEEGSGYVHQSGDNIDFTFLLRLRLSDLCPTDTWGTKGKWRSKKKQKNSHPISTCRWYFAAEISAENSF